MSFALFRRCHAGLGALACGLIVSCITLTLSLVAANSAHAADGTPKLLLLPIVVHSAEDPAYLRDGLSDMLAARFSRIGALELVRPADSEEGTTDLDEALELGRKAGADFVLFGSFTRFGKGASLDVQCSPTDESEGRVPLREIFVHSGSIGEIIPDLDELAGKVSRFARGELISPAALAPDGFASAGSPGTQELIDRIEALEAAITQILEAETDLVDSNVETDFDADLGSESESDIEDDAGVGAE